MEGGIPGDARCSGLKIQGMSHIWRDLFLPHLPYPMWGYNETFLMLVLSILFLCRTGTQRGILSCNTSVMFYPQSQKFHSSSNPKTNITPNTIILGCELVLALRNPILELSLVGNEENSCCGKQARKGEQIRNHRAGDT